MGSEMCIRDRAYETVKLEIDMSDNSFKSSDFDIEVAKRDVLSGICEI